MLKKLFKWIKKDAVNCKIIPRDQHNISRNNISNNALKVLYRLHNAGFAAFLVGGCIRDLLLGRHPKDFDIATNASPEQIQDLFTNCRIIGRRFRLAHVHFGREIIEVATFRAHHAASTLQNMHGMIVRDNVYGSIEEDVLRRDFTVNALYYNIADFSVVDFVGGMQDLAKRQLKLIGDPLVRYREDPVRMLRAVRFAAKLGFTIQPQSAKPILMLGDLLSNIPAARLFEEFSKLFFTGHALITYAKLLEYDLFKYLFPSTIQFNNNSLITCALQNTDARVAENKSVTPSFLLAVFLWQPMLALMRDNMADGQVEYIACHAAMDHVLSAQQRVIAMPRRYLMMVRDMWEMQLRFERRRSARHIAATFASPKFRAAYDFLLLRAQAGEQAVSSAADWWNKYVVADEDAKQKLVAGVQDQRPRRRRKKTC